MKTITTGTEITFTKTNDKFELTQTDIGFDIKPIKLSKNVTSEPYSFQELLDLYEAGKITIEGFEEADGALIRSILTNYVYNTTLKSQIIEIESLKSSLEKTTHNHQELTKENLEVSTLNTELLASNHELTTINKELADVNKELVAQNKDLITKNLELNKALEAIAD